MQKPFSDPSHTKRCPKWVKDQVRKLKEGCGPLHGPHPTKKDGCTYSELVLRSILSLSHLLTSPKISIKSTKLGTFSLTA